MPHAIKISQITYIKTLAVVADILVNSDQRQANINLNVTSYFISFLFFSSIFTSRESYVQESYLNANAFMYQRAEWTSQTRETSVIEELVVSADYWKIKISQKSHTIPCFIC